MENKKNTIKTYHQHKVFLDKYWEIYKRILIENRDDNKIIEFKNSIEETNKNGGKLIFVGNGASASLASHAATDFSKQANIKAIARVLGSTFSFSAISIAIGAKRTAHALLDIKFVVIETRI